MRTKELGQTIVEVAVALAILAIVGGALVAIGLASVRTATEAKLKAEATDLAVEAVEVARHMRDLGSTTSVESLLNIADAGGYAQVSSSSLELEACDACTETIDEVFSRTILVSNASNPLDNRDRVLVVVTVTWGQADINQTVELRTYLSKWFAD